MLEKSSRGGETSPDQKGCLHPVLLPRKRNASPAVYIWKCTAIWMPESQRRWGRRPETLPPWQHLISCYCLYPHLWFYPNLHLKLLFCVELAFFHIEKMKLPPQPPEPKINWELENKKKKGLSSPLQSHFGKNVHPVWARTLDPSSHLQEIRRQ